MVVKNKAKQSENNKSQFEEQMTVEKVISKANLGDFKKIDKRIIPKTGHLFKFREDYITVMAKLQYYQENDPEKFEMN